jgi:hypothetical protein
MNWTAISAVADTFAALAVVLSLVYLGMQIRNQIAESRSAVVNSLTQQWGDFMGRMADGHLNELWRRGIEDFGALDDVERGRTSALFLHFTQIFESLYLQKCDGKVDPDLWKGLEARIRDIYSNPGVRQWWSLRSHWFSPRFQSFIEALLEETEGQNTYAAFLGPVGTNAQPSPSTKDDLT